MKILKQLNSFLFSRYDSRNYLHLHEDRNNEIKDALKENEKIIGKIHEIVKQLRRSDATPTSSMRKEMPAGEYKNLVSFKLSVPRWLEENEFHHFLLEGKKFQSKKEISFICTIPKDPFNNSHKYQSNIKKLNNEVYRNYGVIDIGDKSILPQNQFNIPLFGALERFNEDLKESTYTWDRPLMEGSTIPIKEEPKENTFEPLEPEPDLLDQERVFKKSKGNKTWNAVSNGRDGQLHNSKTDSFKRKSMIVREEEERKEKKSFLSNSSLFSKPSTFAS